MCIAVNDSLYLKEFTHFLAPSVCLSLIGACSFLALRREQPKVLWPPLPTPVTSCDLQVIVHYTRVHNFESFQARGFSH